MADENQDQSIEDEMLRMMEEELGTSGDDAGEEDADAAFEAEMLAAMQDESAVDGGDAAGGGDDDAMGGLESDMLQAMMDETSAATPAEAETALARAQSMLPGTDLNHGNIHRLMGVNLSMIIELGRTEVAVGNLLEWSEGSLIELDRVSGEAVDVYINGKPFARGEVVTIAENFGVRLTEILPYVPLG